jgi:predicted acyl esterase
MNSLILLNFILLLIITICSSYQNDKIFDEEMIEMRDGVSLHTVIFKPQRDISPTNDGKYAVIIDRSPYGYNVTEWLSDLFVPLGFIGIGQDLRGEFKSEGNFSIWHSDANDSYDTCLWIIKQKWSNGIIYSLGASADGIASIQMINHDESPSWLKGQYVIWASSRLGKSAFPSGVYMEWLDRWFERKLPTKIESDRCKAIVREHEGGIDSYWEEIDLTSKYDRVNGSSGFYSGWYDLFITDTLVAFSGYNEESNPAVRSTSRLVIDPLGHCGAYEYFPSNTVLGRTAIPLIEAIETFGKRPVKRHDIKNITFYVMSSNNDEGNQVGNYWTSLTVFPEYTEYNLYANNNGIASNQKSIITSSKSYIYDPSDPIPTIGGQNLAAESYNDCLCGPLDQAGIDIRPDMLVFETKPFDNHFAITGIYLSIYLLIYVYLIKFNYRSYVCDSIC